MMSNFMATEFYVVEPKPTNAKVRFLHERLRPLLARRRLETMPASSISDLRFPFHHSKG